MDAFPHSNMVIETDLVSETFCSFGIQVIFVPIYHHHKHIDLTSNIGNTIVRILRIELLIYLYDQILCRDTHISHVKDQ